MNGVSILMGQTGLNIGGLLTVAAAIFDAAEQETVHISRDLDGINIPVAVRGSDGVNLGHVCTGPGGTCRGAAPVMDLDAGPEPVVTEINRNGFTRGRSHGRHKTDDHGKDHDQAQYPFQCLKSVLHS